MTRSLEAIYFAVFAAPLLLLTPFMQSSGTAAMRFNNNKCHTMNHDNKGDTHHVVIVGGGIAGLVAARELLLCHPNIQVTIVEACDSLGGRIRGNTTFVPNHMTDMGAEYIHGTETLLTELVQEFTKSKWNNPASDARGLYCRTCRWRTSSVVWIHKRGLLWTILHEWRTPGGK